MFQIIKFKGRVPASDTSKSLYLILLILTKNWLLDIAWKVRGPGLSKRFFGSITIDELKILLLGYLENNQLE